MLKLPFPPGLPLALIALGLAASPSSNADAQAVRSAPAKAAKLEGLTYQRARKVILGYGWRPFPPARRGLSVGARTGADFPEIGECSGVDPGYCGMTFSLGSECLYVVTRGGPPEGGVEGDTHVDHVSFRRGPCVND